MNTTEKLRADYYGAFGRQFLSNSDIGTLLNDPKQFGVPREDTKAMLEGRYFHTLMLEPEKIADFPIVNASTRNTVVYKEAVAHYQQPMLLLQSEAQDLIAMSQTMKGNMDICDMIYRKGSLYEEPAIGEIQGRMFKGKADIVHSDLLVDIKTTSDINDFKYSARKYNYDSQAYIYQQLFGRPLAFVAIDKKTHTMGIFNVSEQFVSYGEEKVRRALEVYDMFFGKDATHDITQYILNQTL